MSSRLLLTLALLLSTGLLSACGDKDEEKADDDSKTEEGAEDSRTSVTSELGAEDKAADGSLLAELSAPGAGAGSAGQDGPDPVIPDLGGPGGRLIKGWDRLKQGMKPKDLLKLRPRARGSDLTPLVYTETLESPWIAASYRFDRLSTDIAQVAWLAGPLASGIAAFRGLSKQGLHRWRRRPRFTEDDEHRRALFDTDAGPIRLTMVNKSGEIRLEWTPPRKPSLDPLKAALRAAGGRGGRALAKADPAGQARNARRNPGPTTGIPPRADGAPPVRRP